MNPIHTYNISLKQATRYRYLRACTNDVLVHVIFFLRIINELALHYMCSTWRRRRERGVASLQSIAPSTGHAHQPILRQQYLLITYVTACVHDVTYVIHCFWFVNLVELYLYLAAN